MAKLLVLALIFALIATVAFASKTQPRNGYDHHNQDDGDDNSVRSQPTYKLCTFPQGCPLVAPGQGAPSSPSCLAVPNGGCFTFADGSSISVSVAGDVVTGFVYVGANCYGNALSFTRQTLGNCFSLSSVLLTVAAPTSPITSIGIFVDSIDNNKK